MSGFVLLVPIATVQAQGGQMGDWFSSAINVINKPKVEVKPALTVLEATRKTITIVVSNPTEDTVEVTLSVSARGVARRAAKSLSMTGNSKNGAKGGGLFVDDAPATRKVDSLIEDSALVGWIQAIPRTVTLIPGENKSIPVTVDIPAHVKPGVYSAWIIASTPDRSDTSSTRGATGDIKVTLRDRAIAPKPNGTVPNSATPPSKPESGPRMIRSGAKLEYRVDAPQ